MKNEVVKKTAYDKLVQKFNVIQVNDASNLVKNADYNTKIDEIEKTFLIMIKILTLLNLIS